MKRGDENNRKKSDNTPYLQQQDTVRKYLWFYTIPILLGAKTYQVGVVEQRVSTQRNLV